MKPDSCFYLAEEERYCYHAITSVGVGGGGVVIFPCYRNNSTKNDVIWLKLSGIVPYGVKMNPIELGEIWTKSCLGMLKFAQIYPNSLLPQ